MPFDGEEHGWICGRAAAAAAVNLQRVSSIVRDIRDPCLHRSPAQRSKLLKPERWRSIFDSDGKVFCFEKALKLIILGGVDPSIRPEVWEFLLGCYALDSTTEYRRQLRKARRERYENLIRKCQSMHASVGTGNLAYAVGSRIMDVRSLSKDSNIVGEETRPSSSHAVCGAAKEVYSNLDVTIEEIHESHSENSSAFVDNISCRRNTSNPDFEPSYDASNRFSETTVRTMEEFPENSDFDFPPLPVTNLFENFNQKTDERHEDDDQESSLSHTLRYNDAMHSFQINNNVDLIMESNDLSSDILRANNFDMETCCSDAQRQKRYPKKCQYNGETVSRSRISSEIPSATDISTSISNGFTVNEDRVSEWLWTLHRIAVDVVRTDSHLEYYEDSKNLARMSDILAVYAWIDPATGYCQGMSDLLSPFVILYEDNADAFWCFEMLLRRMRENFQMSGPTGVMKQLQILWKILELTDTEIFMHLSVIGAESLHFAFRMLLVLFRRELSFNEALCMWEMMWAADFDESLFQGLEENCLEPLVLQLPKDQDLTRKINIPENSQKNPKSIGIEHQHDRAAFQCNGLRRNLGDPFCGLTKTNFWARNDQMQICTLSTSTENSSDELPVFCVAAILIINRQKIMRKTHSIDDVIKMFNDNMLKINVKRCIHMAIKLRKKYFYKAH